MTVSFDVAIADFSPALPMAVGLSGGADSTALLLACARKWPGQVQAIHVHHGLQAAADGFEEHCAALCQSLNVPLWVKRLDARHTPGQSPEDAARQARYKAFEAVAIASKAQAAIKSIAIAQHADDQVETLLLALSRGAGIAGLAAMPARWERAGVVWHRPLLQVAGADIRSWLRLQGQPWVEDPTNTDQRYTRNRIRARLRDAGRCLRESLPGARRGDFGCDERRGVPPIGHYKINHDNIIELFLAPAQSPQNVVIESPPNVVINSTPRSGAQLPPNVVIDTEITTESTSEITAPVADAPAPPSKPPQKAARRPSGFGTLITEHTDERVSAYLFILKPEISAGNADLILRRIHLDGIETWRDVLTTWAERGYNRTGFADMFERYDTLRNQKRVKAGTPPKTTAPRMSDEQYAELEAQMEKSWA